MARWSHKKRYFGTFTDSKGTEKSTYLEWSDKKKWICSARCHNESEHPEHRVSIFKGITDSGDKIHP